MKAAPPVDRPIALGLRIKSGCAIAVALAGSRAEPLPILRREVALCDPTLAGTRQPYHAGMGKAQEDQEVIAQLTAAIEACARRSIAALLEELCRAQKAGLKSCATRGGSAGLQSCHAALVVGSVIDPAIVGNPHIRAHAHEGRLFRSVVEHALGDHGIPCRIVVEKALAAEAMRELDLGGAAIKRTVAAFGSALDGPWRADEKAAATAAWMLLR